MLLETREPLFPSLQGLDCPDWRLVGSFSGWIQKVECQSDRQNSRFRRTNPEALASPFRHYQRLEKRSNITKLKVKSVRLNTDKHTLKKKRLVTNTPYTTSLWPSATLSLSTLLDTPLHFFVVRQSSSSTSLRLSMFILSLGADRGKSGTYLRLYRSS